MTTLKLRSRKQGLVPMSLKPDDVDEEYFFDEALATDAVIILLWIPKRNLRSMSIILFYFDTVITEVKTRFNDTTIGVLSEALCCISPVTFLSQNEEAPAE